MSRPQPKFTVAICGAAIGGFSLAAFLSEYSDSQHPVNVDIYESRPEVSTRGAGIGIWKRSWQLLQNLGLDKELDRRGVPHPKDGEARGPVFRKSDQEAEGYEFHSHVMPYGPLTLTRPLLLELLQSKLSADCTVHTNTHLVRYEDHAGGRITLYFKDGTISEADVLVGADGVHSATRAVFFDNLALADPSKADVYRRCIPPRWSGQFVYRTLIPVEKLRNVNPRHIALSDRPQIFCGKSKHALTNPTGEVLNFVMFHTVFEECHDYDGEYITELSKDEVAKAVEGWEPAVQELIKVSDTYTRWAVHVIDPIPLSVHGRVALLGDAAHAMLSHQGVGGGQAIEDAHILGRLLAHQAITKENTPNALKIYQELRLKASQKAAERSKENGMMYEFIHPDFAFDSRKGEPTRDQLTRLGQAIGDSFQWLAVGGCDEDWTMAENMLKNGSTL
ncbi:hypothetical protein EIP91_006040 [Steccherinum ochraceum]|uniref:FAD-binding domain-containing protein n=1 Tax=Steccherinum ochraceum TaxID=92696 RepID=A0A4R0R939_9APHY|nr:hypothetical protein EIP91_006040 [Steccherinum ochraceum]